MAHLEEARAFDVVTVVETVMVIVLVTGPVLVIASVIVLVTETEIVQVIARLNTLTIVRILVIFIDRGRTDTSARWLLMRRGGDKPDGISRRFELGFRVVEG